MSDLAVAVDGSPVPQTKLLATVRQRIRDARADRKQMEPTWHSSMAFAAGKFYLRWHPELGRLVYPDDLHKQELYSADIITEYRTSALGELSTGDDRPELLLRRDDQASEDYQTQLNRALGFGWEYEFKADRALEETRRLCLDLGTSAIRCRFDPTVGKPAADNIPHQDGRPLLDPDEAIRAVAGAAENGRTLEYKSIRQGRITWEPLSSFNLLVPPGVPNEDAFPWEAVIRPAPLSSVRAQYGSVAAELREDTDIGSILGMETGSGQGVNRQSPQGRLADHVWLITYYERPNPQWPDGRTLVLAGNQLKLLHHEDRLPYEGPDGQPRSGISYFHWWRVTGRFWSRGLVEPMKDPQRAMNKRRTQISDIIDRGMPFVMVEMDSEAKNRKGHPVELIELKPTERQPVVSAGVGPGDWFYRDVDVIREDIEHATGLRGPRLGENPANVSTYSQLALINENEQVKRQDIIRGHQRAIAQLVEDSIYDMRRYWGPEKQIALAGDNGGVDAAMFNATQIPPFFIVKVSQGAPKPRSQAAELKKIETIWQASIDAGTPLPISWLYESLQAGQARDLPDQPASVHQEKAELENHVLLQGGSAPVAYYDPMQIHVTIHRHAQVLAELSGDMQAWDRIEQHVQAHVQEAHNNAVNAIMAGPQGHVSEPTAQPQPGLPAPPPTPAPGVGPGAVAPPEPQPPTAGASPSSSSPSA